MFALFMRLHKSILFLLTFILLTSCLNKEPAPETSIELEASSTPTITPEPTVPVREVTENFCTDLGCFTGLFIQLNGDFPSNYIVVANDGQENRIAMQCFEETQGKRYPNSYKDYFLNNPKIKDLSVGIGAEVKSYCSANHPSVMRVWHYNDGSYQSIIVECSTEFVMQSESLFSSCSQSSASNTLSIANFIPEQLNLSVFGEGKEASVNKKPDYYRHQPNGPKCEPTCLTDTIEIYFP